MGNASSRSAKRQRGGDRKQVCKQGRFNSTLPQLLPYLQCRDTTSLAQTCRGSSAVICPRLQELLHKHASQLVQDEEERSLTSEFCFDPPIFASLVSALLPSGETVLTRQAVWVLHHFVECYVSSFLAHASRVASARRRLVQAGAAESTGASPARAASSQLHSCGSVSKTEVTDDDQVTDDDLENNSAATTAAVRVITPQTSPEKDASGRRSPRTHAADHSSAVTQHILAVALSHADVEVVREFVGFDCGGAEEMKGTAGGGTAGNGRSVLLEQGLRRLGLRAKVAYVAPGVVDRLAEIVVCLVRTEVEASVRSVGIGEEDDDWGSDSGSECVVVDAVEHDGIPSLPLLMALSHAQTLYGGPLTLQSMSSPTQCVATRQAQGSADAHGLMSAYDFMELTESLSHHKGSLDCFRPRVPFVATDARLLQNSMDEHVRAVLAAAVAVSGGANIEQDHVRIACELLQVEFEDVTAIARRESLTAISEKLKLRMRGGLTALAGVTLSNPAADALLLHCVSLLSRVLYLHRVVAECLAAQLLEEDGEKSEGRVGDEGLAPTFCEHSCGEVIGTVSKQQEFGGKVVQEVEEEDLLQVKGEDFSVEDGDGGDHDDESSSSRESSCNDGDMIDTDDSDTGETRTLPNKRHRMLQAAVVTEAAMRTSLASRWRCVGMQAVYGRLAEHDVNNVYNSLVPTVVQRAMVWT